MEHVRPGGYIVFVTSRYTMDNAEFLQIRRYLMSKGHFVGAVRLPGGNKGAFTKSAKTEVVTDLIVLQKFSEGETRGAQRRAVHPVAEAGRVLVRRRARTTAAGRCRPTTSTGPPGIPSIPQFILGTEATTGSQHRRERVHGGSDKAGENTQEALEDALRVLLPKDSYQPATTTSTAPEATVAEGGLQAGRTARRPQEHDPARARSRARSSTRRRGRRTARSTSRRCSARAGLIGIRDARRAVVAAMKSSTATDAEIKKLQGVMQRAYDAFVKELRALNSPRTVRLQGGPRGRGAARARSARDDLEGLHEQEREAAPPGHARSRRTRRHLPEADDQCHAGNHARRHAARTRCSRRWGTRTRIDWPFMARITGDGTVTPARIAALQTALRDDGRIFEQPDGAWVARDEYLSGDVVSKLDDATAAAGERRPRAVPAQHRRADGGAAAAEDRRGDPDCARRALGRSRRTSRGLSTSRSGATARRCARGLRAVRPLDYGLSARGHRRRLPPPVGGPLRPAATKRSTGSPTCWTTRSTSRRRSSATTRRTSTAPATSSSRSSRRSRPARTSRNCEPCGCSGSTTSRTCSSASSTPTTPATTARSSGSTTGRTSPTT